MHDTCPKNDTYEGTRKIRRTQQEIEDCIYYAMLRLIKKKGFGNITLKNLEEEAGIDANVFYRRYASMDELYINVVKRHHFWLQEKTPSLSDLILTSPEEFLCYMFRSSFDDNENSIFYREYLKWALYTNPEFAKDINRIRENNLLQLLSYYRKIFENSEIEIETFITCMGAGTIFLTIQKGIGTFGGLDVNHPEDIEKITKMLRQISQMIFDYREKEKRKNASLISSIKKMRKDNIDDRKIAKYLGITPAKLSSLMKTSLKK